MTTSEILTEIATSICPDGPNVPETKIRLRDGVVALVDDVQQGDRLFIYRQENGFASLTEIAPMTAEEYCVAEGFTPVRLISLLDSESKLAQLGKSSAKLTAVRAWLSAITAQYAANSSATLIWPAAPHSFEETLHEVMQELSND